MAGDYDSNHKEEPVFIRLGVKTIVTDNEGRVLLLQRSDKVSNPQDWGFPGGGVDKDEDPAVAAMREVVEEAGIGVESPQLLSVYRYKDSDIVLLCYAVEAKDTEVTLNWESQDSKWASRQELVDLQLPPGHEEFKKAYLEQ